MFWCFFWVGLFLGFLKNYIQQNGDRGKQREEVLPWPRSVIEDYSKVCARACVRVVRTDEAVFIIEISWLTASVLHPMMWWQKAAIGCYGFVFFYLQAQIQCLSVCVVLCSAQKWIDFICWEVRAVHCCDKQDMGTASLHVTVKHSRVRLSSISSFS